MIKLDSQLSAYWDIASLERIRELKEISKEFEALFLRMFLKEAENSSFQGIFNSFSYKLYTDMFFMEVAKVLAEKKSLGIANLVEEAVKAYGKLK
jgi:flagellar protein FlgJ